MKPSRPEKLTAAPASAAETASNTTRIRPAFSPRLRAVSPPSIRTSSSFVSEKAAMSARAVTTAGAARRSSVRLASEPMRKSE